MTRTALIMAGGTGGHIYPGLAVADELRRRGWRIVWLGNADGMEARIVPSRGYVLQSIRFTALRGKGVLRKLLLPLNLLRGFWQSLGVLRRIQPHVVLGLGGYVTFPGGMMAALRGTPLVLHEQNSVAGLANRTLSRVADRVLTGFPETLANAHWTGTPVRADIAEMPEPAVRFAGRSGPLNLLVVGGSLGAQALNAAVPKALALIPPGERPHVTHQAGERNMPSLEAAYETAGVAGTLRPFIEDMAGAYATADLVICRAGALTVAELAAAGVASVLVPFPHAVDDHQTGNARFLANARAAMLVPQDELTAESLAALIRSLNRGHLLDMAQRARALARPGATAEVADICAALAQQNGKT